ncbi:MAG: hypothetical protein LBG57_12755 [Treponema sp.]|jgi:hypothetical protein|nr:hypothetical protein [Treponema sp.]
MKLLWPLSAAVFLVFCACSGTGISSIEREDLFSLDIGPMEDQIAMYKLEGDSGVKRTDFAMRDGLFYIADGNGGKIVRYNSYGDLLFMIYNGETNPEPVSLKTNIEDRAQVTRWAFSYPLREPGVIAVDSRKHIYAGDRLAHERRRFDPENGVLLDGIILHFDADGRFVEYLGQEGIGGSPFPRITGLYTSVRDELAVVCRTSLGWNIYWYSASGALLNLIQLKNSAIPSPPEWPADAASVDNIMAAPDSRRLFLKVDYYRDIFDESTNTRIGTAPDSSLIWILDVEDGSYLNYIEVPFSEYSVTENGRTLSARMLYSIMGVLRGGKVFLYFPIETGYSILFLDTESKEQRRAYIRVDNEELQFNDFHLSAEGIISALLVDEKVKLVWWRTDTFVGEAP